MRCYRYLPAGLAGPLITWLWSGQPYSWGPLLVVWAFAIITWPLLWLASVAGVPAVVAACWPREWRMRWRKTHDRPAIPAWIRRATEAADRHRCLFCWHLGTVNPVALQWDHIRPWSCGGLTSVFNGATLCRQHNAIKSNYWPWPDGRVTYRYRADPDRMAIAAAILAVERRARYNPLRWLRAAWAI